MKDRFCFCAIARGVSKEQAARLVGSARRVGIFKEFHVWTDGAVEGATCHSVAKLQGAGRLMPLRLLDKMLPELRYDYFVWLDPDTFITRPPGDVLRVLQGAPVHSSLEHDATLGSTVHPDWGPCSLSNFTKLMAFKGVHNRAIFTVNDAFWIVHHDVLKRFGELAGEFWWFCKNAGYRFGFAPLLAYATQMLCGNPYVHRLKQTTDLWAPVRTRSHGEKLPGDGTWNYDDVFSGEILKVKPAIVHPLRKGGSIPA